MRLGIFVTVRAGSSRLPNKCYANIDGQPAIQYVIDACKRSRRADAIVLCTTERPEDIKLCDIAVLNRIRYFQGSTEDKLSRWLGAARRFGVDFFVTADGDDLFYSSELIDLAFEQFLDTGADFIQTSGLMCGAFTYGIKTSALSTVCEIKDTTDTEMMWVYFTDTGLFRVEELRNVPDVFKRPEIRATLDYPKDLEFFRCVVRDLHKLGNKEFTTRDVINYLTLYPNVMQINSHLHEVWADNQRSKTFLKLKGR